MIAGNNPDYIYSLVQALASIDLRIELIGGNAYEDYEYSHYVKFINLRKSQDFHASVFAKIIRVLTYYLLCLLYMWKSDVRLVHIQEFRLNFAEGIILASLYRILGKKVVYTAHDIQPKGKDNKFNRILFKVIYRCADHIVCHTPHMKAGLVAKFKILDEKVSVIQRGLNCSVPITRISQVEARNRIGIDTHNKVLLLFGGIRVIKGYEIALQSLKHLRAHDEQLVLLIAGGILKKEDQSYLQGLKNLVIKEGLEPFVKFYDYYIPDNEVELFFKASDVLLLPYTEGDFQSGVLFLAYRFGLPIIASDVGSFPEAIGNEGWGYVFRSKDPFDLAARIRQFYQDLHLQPDLRQRIQQDATKKYSWDATARATIEVYRKVLQ